MGTQREREKKSRRRRKRRSSNVKWSSGGRGGWVTSGDGKTPGFVRLLTGDNNLADAVINVLMCLSCFATILVMGGRTAVGQLTFLTLSLATALAFFIVSVYRAARVRPHWIDIPIMLGIGLVAFQIVPLAPETVASISPEISEILTVWGQPDLAADLPAWQTLSLAPSNTWKQLGLLVAGWLLLIVARHRLGEAEKLAGFLDLMTAAMVGIAVLGLAQLVAGNGAFYWFYEHPFASAGGVAHGPFTNPNQFGGCLALGIVWPLWRLLAPISEKKDEFGRRSKTASILSVMALGLILPTILLTQSRVAMVCAALAVCGTAVMATFTPRVARVSRGKSSAEKSSKAMRPVLILAVLAGSGVAALTLFGDKLEADVERNVVELSSGDMEKLDNEGSRRSVWSTAIAGSADFPWLGAGLGAHGRLYHRYWEGTPNEKWYSHVENGPLQSMLETGRIGIALIGALVLLSLYRLGRGLRSATDNEYRRPVIGVALIVLAANLAETTTDFVWHVPGIMALVVVVVAGAIGVSSRPLDQYGPRIFPILGCTAALFTAIVFGPSALQSAQAEPYWHSYAHMSKSEKPSTTARLMQLKTLIQAHAIAPDDPAINAALAKAYLWSFDFGQDKLERFKLADLRDVVRGGGWDSVEDVQQWLRDESVAADTIESLVAARRHAIESLRSEPLNVRATLIVLKTNFLVNVEQDADEPLYAQMLAINPMDAVAHFEVGIEAMRQGDAEKARTAWKIAYDNDTRIRRSLATLIASQTPAAELLELLKPDAESLSEIEGVYESLMNPEGEIVIALARGQAWEQRANEETHSLRRIHFLRKSANGYERGGQLEDAERIARIAVEIGPADMIARRTLGEVLRTREKWAEAAEHLLWCSQLKGNDSELRARANDCLAKSRQKPEIQQVAAPMARPYR